MACELLLCNPESFKLKFEFWFFSTSAYITSSLTDTKSGPRIWNLFLNVWIYTQISSHKLNSWTQDVCSFTVKSSLSVTTPHFTEYWFPKYLWSSSIWKPLLYILQMFSSVDLNCWKSTIFPCSKEISVINVGLWAWFVTSQQKPILVHYSTPNDDDVDMHSHIFWWHLVCTILSHVCIEEFPMRKKENIPLIILSFTFSITVILDTGKSVCKSVSLTVTHT